MAVLISVIIPAWNEEKHIEATLKSILANNYPKKNYEIIVVNSASTDATAKIAKKYADKVINGPKKGAGYARNIGAKHAKGGVLAFIDADTSADKTWLSAIDDSLIKQDFDAATGNIKPKESNASLRIKLIYLITDLGCRITFKTSHPGMIGYNFIAKKKYFDKAGGFSVHQVIEDWELSKKLYQSGARFVYNKDISVRTSSRRFKAVGIISYTYKYLITYLLFGKTAKPEEYWKKSVD